MTYLESQHNDSLAAREEARKLRIKLKTFERYLGTFCGIYLCRMYLCRIKYTAHACGDVH